MLEMIQEHLVGIICSGVASFAAGTLAWAIKRLKGICATQESISIAVRADSRDKIRRFGKFYVITNQITPEEREDLSEIFEGYSRLGGNGAVKELYEECMELPIVPQRTKWNPYYVGTDGFLGK